MYVTGDTHGNLDCLIRRIKDLRDDIVLVTGDFGFVWDNSNKENRRLNILEQFLAERNLKVITCYGNHSGRTVLKNEYQETDYCGGKAKFIRSNIIYLENGYVFNIADKKIFVMGGAESIDKANRIEGVSWWREEVPSTLEFNRGLDSLDLVDWKVDYVLTHTCPLHIVEQMYKYHWTSNIVEKYLEQVYQNLEFDKWFFGHHHTNEVYGKCICLYKGVKKF